MLVVVEVNARMCHDGPPPLPRPPVNTNWQLQLVYEGLEGGGGEEKNLEGPHHNPISTNTSEELTFALSGAIRNVKAKCYTAGEVWLRPLP